MKIPLVLRILYNKKEIRYDIKTEEIAITDIDPVTLGWTLTEQFGTLPEGITVYKSFEMLGEKNIKAYIAVVDMAKNRKFRVYGKLQVASDITPNKVYEETKYPIIINGGYFYYSSATIKLHHIGILVQDGVIVQEQASTVTRPDTKGNNAVYRPTRSIFSQSIGGAFQADWVYSAPISKVTYAYEYPVPLKAGVRVAGEVTNAETDPLPEPSLTYPSVARRLHLQEAVGAGPLLLKDGKIWDTWREELWDTQGGTNATFNVQRSAIGVTENKKLILFASEGRNTTPGIPGLTTAEVAKLLQDLGCVDAMNLDGGGSVCMLINGQETIIPNGGAGAQRGIVTAIGIE